MLFWFIAELLILFLIIPSFFALVCFRTSGAVSCCGASVQNAAFVQDHMMFLSAINNKCVRMMDERINTVTQVVVFSSSSE